MTTIDKNSTKISCEQIAGTLHSCIRINNGLFTHLFFHSGIAGVHVLNSWLISILELLQNDYRPTQICDKYINNGINMQHCIER